MEYKIIFLSPLKFVSLFLYKKKIASSDGKKNMTFGVSRTWFEP